VRGEAVTIVERSYQLLVSTRYAGLRERLERALFAAQRYKIVCFEAWKLYLDDPNDPRAETAWHRYMVASRNFNRIARLASRSGIYPVRIRFAQPSLVGDLPEMAALNLYDPIPKRSAAATASVRVETPSLENADAT
jgi:hypothetical protein